MASVGEPGRRVSPTLSAPTTPLLATSAVPQQQLFPIARWRPRSGLTMQHHHFKRGVVQLFAAFGLAPEAMQEKAPTIRINPHSSDSAAGKPGGDVPDVVAAQTAALHHWQRVNTALYWHIVPAVDIAGPQYLEDLAHIDSFVSGQQADARGLLVWLFRFVDLSGFDAQLALSNALGTVKLGDGATLAQLASHVHKLQQVWLLTASATASYTSCDSAPLVQLYEYLLASMPTTYTAPGGMHMVSVRTWLVGKCADLAAGGGASVLSSYSTGTQAMLQYAATLGVPQGAALPDDQLHAIVSKPDGIKWQVDWANGGTKTGTLLPLSGSRQPTPRNPGGEAPRSDNKGNNCSFCPSNACRSLDFVSPADVHKKCISVWNSTFDLNKLSPGKRVVVTTLRAYSKEHPDATTLKNVDLKITRQGRGDAARGTQSGEPGGKGKGARGGKRGDGSGGVTALFDFRALVADGLSATTEEFDAMIDELDAESPCIMMLGDAKGTLSDATLVVEAVVSEPSDAKAPAPSADPLEASDCAIAALEEARVALAERDAELQALRDQDQERAAAIARLEDALLTATTTPQRVEQPTGMQPRTQPTPTLAPTPMPGDAQGSTPATNPALVPAEQQATAAMAAAAAVAAVTAAASPALSGGGGDITPSQASAFSSPQPSPQVLMPLLGGLSAPNTRDKSSSKLTTMEHLATAALMLAQDRDKKNKKGLLSTAWHKTTNRVLTLLSDALASMATMDKAQWASTINKSAALLVVTRAFKPWLQPLIAVAMRAVASHVTGSLRAMLSDALWGVLMRLVRLRDLIKGKTLQLVTTEAIARVDNSDAFTTLVNSAPANPSLMMLVSTAASINEPGMGAASAHVHVDERTGMLMSNTGVDERTGMLMSNTAFEPVVLINRTVDHTLRKHSMFGGSECTDLVWYNQPRTRKAKRVEPERTRDTRVPLERLRSMLLCMQMLRRKRTARRLEYFRRFVHGWNGNTTPFRRFKKQRHRPPKSSRPTTSVPSLWKPLDDWQRDMMAKLKVYVNDTWEHSTSWADLNECGVDPIVEPDMMAQFKVTDCCRECDSDDGEETDSFARPLDYDSGEELERFFIANRPTPSQQWEGISALIQLVDYDSGEELERFFNANVPTPSQLLVMEQERERAELLTMRAEDPELFQAILLASEIPPEPTTEDLNELNLQAGIAASRVLFMLGPGTKRAAAFSQPTRADVTNESMTALVAAWCALLNGGTPGSAMAELTALAPHLGIKRVHKHVLTSSGGESMGTLSALATALAPLVWPGRYAGLMLAVRKYNDGKQESTCQLHYSKVNKLIQALGGIDAVRSAVIEHQASTGILALASASTIEPSVSVVIGTTGVASRPIMLRLFVVSRSDMSHSGAASTSMSTLMPLHEQSTCSEPDWASDILSGLGCMADAPWVDMLTDDALVELECAFYRSRTPSPGPWDEGLPLRLDSLYMISTEEQWEYPPGTVVDGNACFPALCDDGASYDASCSRSLSGAMLDTYSAAGECQMGVGTNDSGLESKGSYIFVFERFGSDGSGELVARRMRHTPNLPVHMVFSEGAEVYSHNYKFVFTKQGRVMTTSTGKQVPLYMGAQTKLGWLKVKPVVDQARAQKIFRALDKQQGGSIMPLGDGQPRSSGMPKDTLRGVALLRRKHVVNGHCSLRKLLSILKAEGAAALVTKDDLREYASMLCGACESAKQKRRAFTIQTLTDHTKAPVGKKWIWDACKLRVPSAQHGYVSIFLAVCDTSNKHFVCGLLGETAEDYKRAHNQLANFNRPHHGEIHVVRGDTHPSHAAREFRDYCTDSQKHLQLGPPYVHEASAAKSEVAFLVGVPTAIALLMGAVDLGDSHQYTAFNTAIAAWDYAASDATADGVITSANMRYYGKTEWICQPAVRLWCIREGARSSGSTRRSLGAACASWAVHWTGAEQLIAHPLLGMV